MGQLILTIPDTPAGRVAVEHLRSRASRELGCAYLVALADYVRGLRASPYLQSLPYAFHLVATDDGEEAAVGNRILGWHSREAPEGLRGQVESVELNLRLYPSASLGLPFHLGGNHSSYLAQMRVGDAHHIGVKGAGVRVAILDTGLDQNATAKAQDFYDVENIHNLHPIPSAAIDQDGHGTAMAELVHAVAPDAEIFVIRVLDTGNLNLWNLLAGVGIAVADCEADLVNLSLGFSSLMQNCSVCGAAVGVRSLAFEKLAATATPVGGNLPVYLASVGNLGTSNSFDFPASSHACVAVGAVDSAKQRSSFSNYGISHPRYLMAPGGQGTAPGSFSEHVGTGSTNTVCAGTSVSTAYASGMLALFRSESRYASLGRGPFVDSILQNHCELPAHASGKPTEYGSGLIFYAAPAVSSGVPDPGASTTARIWTDGDDLFVGGVRVKVNRRF